MFTKETKDQIMNLLANFIAAANEVNPERNGCAVVIVDKNTGKPVFQEFIGKMIPGKTPEIKYWYNAIEKAKRLFDNLAKGHVTSAQSANMETNYPGAVLCGDYIVSVSGQNMWLDEAIAAWLGSGTNWIEKRVLKLIKENSNQRFSELSKEF